MKFVIASGYFNPLRPTHIEYLSLAKNLGDRLIVIVNNDEQVKLKREVPFMNERDRRMIINSLKCVDSVVMSIDKDATVCETIRDVHNFYSNLGYKFQNDVTNSIIFAKGGDRFAEEIPESSVCKELGIKIVDRLGKKDGSSSELLEDYFNARVASILAEPLKIKSYCVTPYVPPSIDYCKCEKPELKSYTSGLPYLGPVCKKCEKYTGDRIQCQKY